MITSQARDPPCSSRSHASGGHAEGHCQPRRARIDAFVLFDSYVQSQCVFRSHSEEPCGSESHLLQVDSPLPVTLSTSAFTIVVAQPEPNVVTVDAIVTAPRGDTGNVFLGFRFPRPGALAVELNPGWQTSPAGVFCPCSDSPRRCAPRPGVERVRSDRHEFERD